MPVEHVELGNVCARRKRIFVNSEAIRIRSVGGQMPHQLEDVLFLRIPKDRLLCLKRLGCDVRDTGERSSIGLGKEGSLAGSSRALRVSELASLLVQKLTYLHIGGVLIGNSRERWWLTKTRHWSACDR